MYAGAQSGICQLWKRSRGRTLRTRTTAISLTSRLVRGVSDSRANVSLLFDTLTRLPSFFSTLTIHSTFTRHFSTERSNRWIGTTVLAKESYLETLSFFVLSSRGNYCFEDEHHLPRETGSAIAGRQVAAIEERRNVEEVSIPARLLLNCFAPLRLFRFAPLSVGERGPIVILRACSFAPLCIVAVTAGRRLFVKGNLAR